VITGDGGGNMGLLPDAIPHAASALLEPTSKDAATKMENEGFIGLSQLCVANSTEVSCNGSLRCSTNASALKPAQVQGSKISCDYGRDDHKDQSEDDPVLAAI
jgi:hypothetical protein